MGRRWGKTVLGGAIALAAASRGAKVAWAVPAYKNGRPVWRWAEGAVWQLKKAKRVDVNRSERMISFDDGGFLGIYSMDNPGSIRGEAFHLVILDEAAMMPEEAWQDAIQPTLADYAGDAILISTPKGRNWFWKEWAKGQGGNPEQKSWKAPSRDNPNPRIQHAAEMARTRVPERSYLQEWEAEFIEDAGSVFRRVSEAAIAPWPVAPYPGQFVMGVDWGRSIDFTVLVVMDVRTQAVVDFDRFNTIGWELQRRRLVEKVRQWKASSIVAEENSIGEPNIERLQAESLPIQGFVTTNSTKAEIIEALATGIETKETTFPNIPELVSELQAYTYDKLPSGLIRYGAPSGMHDDCVMAYALAWYAAKNIRSGAVLSGGARVQQQQLRQQLRTGI